MLGRLFKQQSTPTLNPVPSNPNNNSSSSSNNNNNSNSNSNNANGYPHHYPPSHTHTKYAPTQSTPSSVTNSYDDSYMREILYGTSEQLKPFHYNSKSFRLVVCQDGGSLRSKQVLFDSANERNTTASPSSLGPKTSPISIQKRDTPPASSKIPSQKVHHNINDLNDYMFGCGLPTSENQSTTKIHILRNPSVAAATAASGSGSTSSATTATTTTTVSAATAPTSSTTTPPSPLHPVAHPLLQLQSSFAARPAYPVTGGSSSSVPSVLTAPSSPPTPTSTQSVLITRLFSICDEVPITAPTADWKPTAALPIREISVPRKVNSRFSIGLVVPIEDDQITDTLLQNWNEISHYMIILQKMLTKKLISLLDTSSSSSTGGGGGPPATSYGGAASACPFISNKRIQFPNYILQGEYADLSNQLYKLIKLVNYNSNIPRLVNLNQIMTTNPRNLIVYSWISEILNWLEYKDGNYSFLASLFSVVGSLRCGLKRKPLDGVPDDKDGRPGHSREISRIVIMTGNPMVAKKLIFILNGLIPNNAVRFVAAAAAVSPLKKQSSPSSAVRRAGKGGGARRLGSPDDCVSPTPITQVVHVDDDVSSSDSSSDSSDEEEDLDLKFQGSGRPIPARPPLPRGRSTSFVPGSSLPKPIPIRQPSVASGFVGSPDSIKGWEIGSSYSGSTLGKPRIETDTKVIPIVQQAPVHRSSLSKSTSMAYLSSSLNSSLSSSISNYSLSKFSSSFLDKWKNFGGTGAPTGASGAYSGGSGYSNSAFAGPGSGGNSYGTAAGSYTTSGYGPPPFGGSSGGGGSFEPNLNKRNSIQSLRSPSSPAVEAEDLFNTYGNITNSGVSAHKNLSRTQSIFDISEGLTMVSPPEATAAAVASAKQAPVVRTRTSIMTKRSGDSPDEGSGALPGARTSGSGGGGGGATGGGGAAGGAAAASATPAHNQSVIKLRCLSIMKTTPKYTRASAEGTTTLVVEAKTLLPDSLTVRNALLPSVAFSDEFRPEFIMQSCPINPKLDSLIMNAMKNDLMFFQNNCGVENVTSKTLFISLRAREIRLIEKTIGGDATDPAGASLASVSSNPATPTTSHTSATAAHAHGPAKHSNYKTTVRKIFTPQKNSGNKERIHEVEASFRELSAVFAGPYRDPDRIAKLVFNLIK